MKRTCSLFILLILAMVGEAKPVLDPPLADSVKASDLIVVGTLTNVALAGAVDSHTQAVVNGSGSILVEEFLKGNVATSLVALAWQHTDPACCGGGPEYETWCTKGPGIWFLQRTNQVVISLRYYGSVSLEKKETIVRLIQDENATCLPPLPRQLMKREDPAFKTLPCSYKISSADDGGTLSGIAKFFYGDGSKWPAIYEANKTIIKNPDRISPGMGIVIPAISSSPDQSDLAESEKQATSTVRDGMLSSNYYDVVECVFRYYLTTNTPKRFQFAIGTNGVPLPADFMSRFQSDSPIAQSEYDGFAEREVLGLGLRDLWVSNDVATADCYTFSRGGVLEKQLTLARTGDVWTVVSCHITSIGCR